MELIDKAALVAWIKRRWNEYPCDNSEQNIGYHCAYYEIQDFLNTLEVKVVGVDLGDLKGDKSAKYIIDTKTLEVEEADLEKEIEEVKHNYKVDDNRHTSICSADIEWLAKHFFELGLFSTLTWQDIRLIAEIGNDFMNSEESDNLTEEAYYGAILDKVREKGRDAKTSWSENRKAKRE